MSFGDLIFACTKLIAAYEMYDELYFMRIHNPANCKAFDKYIESHIKTIKELCEEELKK